MSLRAGMAPELRVVAEHVRCERIQADLDALSALTATPGEGVTRLAYSPEDKAARGLVEHLMHAAGLSVYLDAAGNLVGRRAGTDDSRKAIATGSHYDSVVNAGAYDGLAGVVCAIEVVRALDDAGIRTAAPIEVLAFAAEESARFRGFSRIGSRAMAGVLEAKTLREVKDATGVSIRDAMIASGLDPDRIPEARRGPDELDAFIELHIEQGNLLVGMKGAVGVVDAITGSTRLRINLQGQADHSGATRMADRRDALLAAAELIVAVEQAALDVGGTVVATVGDVKVAPGSMSVVPGTATLLVDIRDVGLGQERVLRRVEDEVSHISLRRRVEASIEVLRDERPTQMAERVITSLEQAAEKLATPAVRIPSLSGHDTITMSRIVDVGMLMVRNASGRSHSTSEQVELDDIELGAKLLLAAVLNLATPRSAKETV